MYKQYLEVKKSKTGLGIFTNIQIPANVPIVEFTGNIVERSKLPEDSSNYLQISDNRFISPAGTMEGVDYLNHSCNPNCTISVVGNRAILYSLYVITDGSELTFDYSTTSTDTHDVWKMSCSCGAHNCRKIISGFQYLSDELKQEYKDKDLVPLFLKELKFI